VRSLPGTKQKIESMGVIIGGVCSKEGKALNEQLGRRTSRGASLKLVSGKATEGEIPTNQRKNPFWGGGGWGGGPS